MSFSRLLKIRESDVHWAEDECENRVVKTFFFFVKFFISKDEEDRQATDPIVSIVVYEGGFKSGSKVE